jgi:PKD repeat protein
VKENVEDKMLRDLFRHKLENAEITPSAEAGARLMAKVGRREFMRFNPSRFNIWYAGGVAVAGAALAIILSTHKTSETSYSEPIKQSEPVTLIVTSENTSAGAPQKVTDSKVESGKPVNRQTGKAVVQNTKRNNIESLKGNKAEPDIKDVISPVNGTDALKGTSVASKHDNSLSHKYVSLSGASVNEGCAPLKVSFKNLSAVYDSCRWTFGDGGSSVIKNPTWIFDVPGEYKVTLTISGNGGQASSSTMTITVHGHPEARFEYSPANAILPADEISFHNYTGDAVRYKWNFGDGTTSDIFEPSHTYSKAGRYTIKMYASNEYGCSDSVIVKNAFSGTGNYINFPNAFIPNLNGPSTGTYSQKSDESAQVFHPVSSGVSEYQLRIFSRRGILIFESNDVNIGWDGYLKGQICEPGVYIWKARGTFLNGETFTRMGDITLLKY